MPSSNKFLKPHIPQPGLLEPNPGNPLGYVTNDGVCGTWFRVAKNLALYIMEVWSIRHAPMIRH